MGGVLPHAGTQRYGDLGVPCDDPQSVIGIGDWPNLPLAVLHLIRPALAILSLAAAAVCVVGTRESTKYGADVMAETANGNKFVKVQPCRAG